MESGYDGRRRDHGGRRHARVFPRLREQLGDALHRVIGQTSNEIDEVRLRVTARPIVGANQVMTIAGTFIRAQESLVKLLVTHVKNSFMPRSRHGARGRPHGPDMHGYHSR